MLVTVNINTIATSNIIGEPVNSSLAAENPHCSVVCMQLKITLDWLCAPTSVFPNCPAILQTHHLTRVVRKVLRYEWPKVALANKTEAHALRARQMWISLVSNGIRDKYGFMSTVKMADWHLKCDGMIERYTRMFKDQPSLWTAMNKFQGLGWTKSTPYAGALLRWKPWLRMGGCNKMCWHQVS